MEMLRRRNVLLALSLALIVGCTRQDERTRMRVVRLLEHLEGAEIHGPGTEPSSWPKGIKPAALGEGASRNAVARLLMHGPQTPSRSSQRQYGDDSRLALLAPTSSRYRFEVDLPADPVLTLGLGYLPPDEEGPRVGYQVALEDENGRVVLLDEMLTTKADGGWLDRSIPLDDWGGKRASLELATETGGPSLVWAAWSSPEIRSRSIEEEGWNVILIMLDTLRADRLGVYGYDRPTSPHLDALARRSVRFAQTVAQSPWTRPSHRSLFSGLYPASTQGLQSPPLASILWKEGYRTLALTGGGYVHSKFGFDEGFDSYRVHDWLRDSSAVTKSLVPKRRQFLFLHTYEIHDPYTHDGLAKGFKNGRLHPGFSGRVFRDMRPLTEEEIEYVRALYDGGVAFTDQRLGELLRELDAAGAFDSSIIIVTSDHGEELWEHNGFRHGKKLYDEQILVPLIVWLPPALRQELDGQVEGRVVHEQVRLIDLYPTVLDLLGLPLGHSVQGRSLRPLLRGDELPELDAYSEATITTVQLLSLRSPRYKFIQTVDGNNAQFFDLLHDPQERQNLAASSMERIDLLRQRVRSIRSGGRRPEDVVDPDDLDPDLRDQLRALGYIK